MAEPTPAPGCPPCDECCKTCCDQDCSCGADCVYRIVITPDDLPDVLVDCCGSSIQMDDPNGDCAALDIEACCNGIDGCDRSTCKNILWVVCNKTNRCIEVFTTFRISNLRSGRNPNPVCPDEDTDCCMLQYRGSTGGDCKWNEGATFEPNGIAPGPGFCMPPCSEASICVNYRTGNPANECGCKKYSDSLDSDKDCCEAVANLSEPCAVVCCTDNPNQQSPEEVPDSDGCSSNCRQALESGSPPVDCPDCCGCCEPDQTDITNDGWTIISSPTNCCLDLVLKTTDTNNWHCCEVGDCTQNNPPDDWCQPIIELGFINEEYACADPDNEFCSCLFEPVPAAHPEYIAPCVCNPGNGQTACFGSSDDCEWGTALVVQGSDLSFFPGDCCYQQDREAVTDVCSSSPCSFADTANSACAH